MKPKYKNICVLTSFQALRDLPPGHILIYANLGHGYSNLIVLGSNPKNGCVPTVFLMSWCETCSFDGYAINVDFQDALWKYDSMTRIKLEELLGVDIVKNHIDAELEVIRLKKLEQEKEANIIKEQNKVKALKNKQSQLKKLIKEFPDIAKKEINKI